MVSSSDPNSFALTTRNANPAISPAIPDRHCSKVKPPRHHRRLLIRRQRTRPIRPRRASRRGLPQRSPSHPLRAHRGNSPRPFRPPPQCWQRRPSRRPIRHHLTPTSLLHADETGVRCEGKTHRLLVVSNTTHTLYTYSNKRGMEGIAVGQVLPDYQAILGHDSWAAYDTLDCRHSRCNAHLLRELTACVESSHHWAQSIMATLLAIENAFKPTMTNGSESAYKPTLNRTEHPVSRVHGSSSMVHRSARF